MKITDVRTTVVSVPYKQPETWSQGSRLGITAVVVEVDTDEGITGIGEVCATPSAEVVKSGIDSMGQAILGQDPHNIHALRTICSHHGYWTNYSQVANNCFCAIETACWDIIGKGAGQPVANLLGGPVHDKMNFYYYLVTTNVEAEIEEAAQAARDGWKVIYFKVGFDDARDIALVSGIRKAVGDGITLRIDANGAWSVSQAIRMINTLNEWNIDFVEQPTRYDDWAGLAQVRRSVPVAVAIDQGAVTDVDCWRVLNLGAADVLVGEPNRCGGLWPLKKIAKIAEWHNVRYCKHSPLDLGISLAANMQVCVTMPNLTSGNQTYGTWIVDDIIVEDLRTTFVNGDLPLPAGPGLGVTLDPDRLAKYHDHYKRHGQYMRQPVMLAV